MSNVPPKFPKGLNVALQEASPSVVNGNMYYDNTLNRFIAREGGTTLSVIAPTDYITITSTTGAPYTATGDADIWYVPTTAFKLTLTAGTWDIYCYWHYLVRTTAGTGAVQMALSTSTTPGTGIIAPVYGSSASTSATNRQSAVYSLQNYTVGSTTDLYVHMRAINLGSYVNASVFQYGSTDIVNSIMTAKRVKYA